MTGQIGKAKGLGHLVVEFAALEADWISAWGLNWFLAWHLPPDQHQLLDLPLVLPVVMATSTVTTLMKPTISFPKILRSSILLAGCIWDSRTGQMPWQPLSDVCTRCTCSSILYDIWWRWGQNENFLAHLHTQQVTYILRIYTHGSAAIIALWSLGQLVVHQSTWAQHQCRHPHDVWLLVPPMYSARECLSYDRRPACCGDLSTK